MTVQTELQRVGIEGDGQTFDDDGRYTGSQAKRQGARVMPQCSPI